MSTLRRAAALRASFQLGSFSVSEIADLTGESSHYVQNLIAEFAQKGYFSALDKIRLRRPGPPQKVWVLEPSMQEKLLEHISPLYQAHETNARPEPLLVGRTEPRSRTIGSVRSARLKRESDGSLIAYHFVERSSDESAASECQSTTVEIQKKGDWLVIKDVLDQVYRSHLGSSTKDRTVMLDENKIASGAATLYSCLYSHAAPGVIVHLQHGRATFTIAVGERVVFSRTRHFSRTKAIPEIDSLWRKLTGSASHSVLKNFSVQPEEVFATIIEGVKADSAFFSQTHPGRRITNILLSGIAPIDSLDLVKIISQRFGIPCEASDPLRVVHCDSIEDVLLSTQNLSRHKPISPSDEAAFQRQLGVFYKSAPLIGYAIRSLGERTPGGVLMPPKTGKPTD